MTSHGGEPATVDSRPGSGDSDTGPGTGPTPVVYPGESPTVRAEATDLGRRHRRIASAVAVSNYVLPGALLVLGVLLVVLAGVPVVPGGVTLPALGAGLFGAGTVGFAVVAFLFFELPLYRVSTRAEYLADRPVETVRDELRAGYLPNLVPDRAVATAIEPTDDGLQMEVDRPLGTDQVRHVVRDAGDGFAFEVGKNGEEYATGTVRAIPDGDATTVEVTVSMSRRLRWRHFVQWNFADDVTRRLLELGGYEVVDGTTEVSLLGVVTLPSIR